MPPSLLQYVPIAAFTISLLALLVSFANLGWNIYRELALRARLKVSFSVRQIYHESFPEPLTKVFLSAINFGPGSIKIGMIVFKQSPLWRKLLRHEKHGVIIWDYTEPLSGKLPAKLEIGDSIDLLFKYDPSFRLQDGITHIGLQDSYGRYHWATTKDVRKFIKAHTKSFPQQSTK